MRVTRAECARITQNGETRRLYKSTKSEKRASSTVHSRKLQKHAPTEPRDSKEFKKRRASANHIGEFLKNDGCAQGGWLSREELQDLFRKQPNGSWLYALVMWNSNKPA